MYYKYVNHDVMFPFVRTGDMNQSSLEVVPGH